MVRISLPMSTIATPTKAAVPRRPSRGRRRPSAPSVRIAKDTVFIGGQGFSVAPSLQAEFIQRRTGGRGSSAQTAIKQAIEKARKAAEEKKRLEEEAKRKAAEEKKRLEEEARKAVERQAELLRIERHKRVIAEKSRIDQLREKFKREGAQRRIQELRDAKTGEKIRLITTGYGRNRIFERLNLQTGAKSIKTFEKGRLTGGITEKGKLPTKKEVEKFKEEVKRIKKEKFTEEERKKLLEIVGVKKEKPSPIKDVLQFTRREAEKRIQELIPLETKTREKHIQQIKEKDYTPRINVPGMKIFGLTVAKTGIDALIGLKNVQEVVTDKESRDAIIGTLKTAFSKENIQRKSEFLKNLIIDEEFRKKQKVIVGVAVGTAILDFGTAVKVSPSQALAKIGTEFILFNIGIKGLKIAGTVSKSALKGTVRVGGKLVKRSVLLNEALESGKTLIQISGKNIRNLKVQTLNNVKNIAKLRRDRLDQIIRNIDKNLRRDAGISLTEAEKIFIKNKLSNRLSLLSSQRILAQDLKAIFRKDKSLLNKIRKGLKKVKPKKVKPKIKPISLQQVKIHDQIKDLSKRISKELQAKEGKLNKFDSLRLRKKIEGIIREKITKKIPISQINIPKIKASTRIKILLKKLIKKKGKPLKRRPISVERFKRDDQIKDLSKRISKELQAKEGKLNKFDSLRLRKRIEKSIRDKLGKDAPISQINIPKIKASTRIKNFFKGILKRKPRKRILKIKPRKRILKIKPISLKQLRREEAINKLSEKISKGIQERTRIKLNQFDDLRLRKKIETKIKDKLGKDKNLIDLKIPEITPKLDEIKNIISPKKFNLQNQRVRVVRDFVKQFEKSRGKISNNKRKLLERNLLKNVNDRKIRLKEIVSNTKNLKSQPKIIDLPRLKIIKESIKKSSVEVGKKQRLLLKTKKLQTKTKSKIIHLEEQIPKYKSKLKQTSLKKQVGKQKQLQKQLQKTRARLKQESVLIKKTIAKTKTRLFPPIPLTKNLQKQVSLTLQKTEQTATSLLKSDIIAKTVSETASLLKQKLLLKQKMTKAQRQKLVSKLKQKLREKKKPKKLRLPKKKPLVQMKVLKKPVPVFEVHGKRFGKKVILKKRLTEKDAKNFLARELDTTLMRTANLVPKGKSKIVVRLLDKYTGAYAKSKKKFRTFRLKKGKKIPLEGRKFIEKKAYVGDTRQEIAQLQLARKRKAKKLKTLKKKKSIIKSKRTGGKRKSKKKKTIQKKSLRQKLRKKK